MTKPQKAIATILTALLLFQGVGLNFFSSAQGLYEQNQAALRETQRLDPLLIFSNTSPKEFNQKMAQAISQALGVDIAELFTPQEWEALVRETIQASQEATFQALMKRVKEEIAKKTRKRIVKSFEDIEVTQYAKKVVRKEFAKYLDRTLKTDWDPWVEKILVENAAIILTEALAKSQADFLLKPEFYNTIYQTLKTFFTTKIEDLPVISDLLSAKLVDYLPGGDILVSINDFIDERIKTFKEKVTEEAYTKIAEPITRAIFKAIAGVLPPKWGWLGGFLGALETTVNDILKQAIGEYVDKYITDAFRDNFWTVYNLKNKLSEWVEATVKDVLPPKTQKDVEKTLLQILPEDAREFFIDVMAIAKAIAEALTPDKAQAAAEKGAGEKVTKILFPGLEEFLQKTFYEVFCDITINGEKVFKKTICEKSIIQGLPSEFTQPIISLIPQANTTILDLLLPQYADILKKNLLAYLPPDKRHLLTTPLKDLSQEELAELKGYIAGNRSLLELMDPQNREALQKSLLEMMSPETRNIFQSSLRDLLPEVFRKTPLGIFGINPSQSLLSYMSEDVKTFVSLIYQYIPDPKEREWINPLLNTLEGSVKEFIAQPTSSTTLGLGKPELADLLDTSFLDLLVKKDYRDQIARKDLASSTRELSLVQLVEKQFQGETANLAQKLTEKINQSGPSQKTKRTLTLALKELNDAEFDYLSQKVREDKSIKQILAEDPQVNLDRVDWPEIEKTDWKLNQGLTQGLGYILTNNLKKILRMSLIQIMGEAGLREPATGKNIFEVSVLGLLRVADPKVYRTLTTGLGDILGQYLVGQILNDNLSPENQEKSIVLMLGEKLYGPELKEEIEKKMAEVELPQEEKTLLTHNLGDLLPLQLATLWEKIAQQKSLYDIMVEANSPQVAKLNLEKIKNNKPDLYQAILQPLKFFLHQNIQNQIQNNSLTQENQHKSITLLIAEKIAGPKLQDQLNKSPVDFIPFLSKTIVELLDQSLPSSEEIANTLEDRLTAAQLSSDKLKLFTKNLENLSTFEKENLWKIMASSSQEIKLKSLQEIVREDEGNVKALLPDKLDISEIRISPAITAPLHYLLPRELILEIKEGQPIGPGYQAKSILDIIGEKMARFSFSGDLSKSFVDWLPQPISTILGGTYGDILRNIYPFNKTIMELLPQSWQKTIKECLGLTTQDIEKAVRGAIEETKGEISQILYSNLEWTANTLVIQTAAIFNKKLAKKIGQEVLTEEKLKEINKNIAEAMEPIIEKAIERPVVEGYLIDSLNEIYLGE